MKDILRMNSLYLDLVFQSLIGIRNFFATVDYICEQLGPRSGPTERRS